MWPAEVAAEEEPMSRNEVSWLTASRGPSLLDRLRETWGDTHATYYTKRWSKEKKERNEFGSVESRRQDAARVRRSLSMPRASDGVAFPIPPTTATHVREGI